MEDPELIQLDENSFVFDFPDGSRSEQFFWADEFCGNYAIVTKHMNSGYQFIDRRGNLSQEFEEAFGYSDGFALVRTDDHHGPQFRDINGKLSEEFYAASTYKNGYAPVKKTKTSPRQLRDVLGNISNKHTLIGDLAYRYKNDEIGVDDLPDICFLNSKFFKLIVMTEYCYAKNAGKCIDENTAKETLVYALQYVYDRKNNALIARGDVEYPLN